jgi:hypothetical protein
MSEQLSSVERSTLEAFEAVIEKGLASFVEVGNALMRIRDSRLYRESHGTFEDYCQEKWGMSRVHAHRLVEAASVVEMLPIGNKPKTESQARPLTLLDTPEEQAEAWQEAVETAPAGKVTAAHVEKVVRRRRANDDAPSGGGLNERVAAHVEPAKQCHRTQDYEYYRAEFDELRQAGGGATQWDKLDQHLKRFCNYFEQLVAERRDNLASRTVEAMAVELWRATKDYRKSVSRLHVEPQAGN